MSSNTPGFEGLFPISAFSYRDVAAPVAQQKPAPSAISNQVPGVSAQEVEALVAKARAEAAAEMQKHMQAEMETKLAEEKARILESLEAFGNDQKHYFDRVESEIVQLALTIAARILHREAQVDPMLIAGLVHVALEKLQNGSNVTIRVASGEVEKWRNYTADLKRDLNITIAPDAELGPKDCVLETDLGSADFSIDAQLKEVEKGFFDLLALRPQG